ncbi:MAG TPA: tyrosine--tRNA ligase [Candidatus Hydrogenedentes bacterium]|mgnify:FL=1|jgi:tyrosyl-tRNA synthetase|nr:tyrosine--tRNA ligase [Candidatus Hydrogenedentota bacterium]MDY0031438.1 tyrosine--tRNA ligase [FCB group bacterium]NLT59262.1 tyrosine--tRNA ligase [Candidatus Hydrogenedentota bacterium]HNV20093.1 tyrosine--tRNA ligase [Candidatus Hydrogenedentota bacterium]HNZ18890.1 tyrosine--tRNA ligase [Candidatus Hydrogenedentota bacterium]
MRLIEELEWRGLVNQVTHPELGDRLEQERFTFYCGFDPTAESLHIGNLVPIMGMMHLQRRGHRPLVLVGGGTGLIGDPSGKTEERKLQTRENLERHLAGIRTQLGRLLAFEGDNAATLVNNADWLGELRLLDFLRDIGKHFSVNVMLAKESVRARLEDRDHGISYTEFTYSLLQAYDFLHLHDSFGCRLQVGGSDQWGNIVAGMDLTRRLRQSETFGLTFPLVTKSDGAKFGKSEQGNVWLDPARTSPYKFYQFWINQADADVPRLLRYFTFLPQEEIAGLEQELAAAPEKRAAHRRLAEEVTAMIHGQDQLANAVKASQAMFGGELSGLDDATLEDIFSEMPSTRFPREALTSGKALLDVLVESGVFPSKGEARRTIKSGGVYLNNERIAEDARLSEASLCSERIAVVRKGKKHYHLLKFDD